MELVQNFVKEEFVKRIDFDNVELVDKSFVNDEMMKRESDVIYKLKIDGKDTYVYILIEFQSTVDKSIPVRMLLYILQFYDQLMRNTKKGKLPNIFPLMLYNGKKKWTVPDNVRDLIDNNIPEKYKPSFNYYKILINEVSDKVLNKLHNAISAVMILEKSPEKGDLKEKLDQIIECLKNEKILDINIFSKWLRMMLGVNINDEIIDKINDMKGVKTMFETMIENYKKKLKKEGLKEGIREGKKEGIREGKKEAARKMLEKGYDIGIISEITGLSIKEIEEINE